MHAERASQTTLSTDMTLLAATAVLCASSAVLQSPAAVDARTPRAVFERADGTSDVRALAGLDVADPRTLGARRVRFEGVEARVESVRDAVEIELEGGDRVAGLLLAPAEESLSVEIAPGAALSVPLEELRSLRFDRRVPATWTGALERAPEGDRLFRVRGETLERIDGGVEAFSADALKFHGELVGTLSIPWGDVAALFVEPLGGDARPADPGVPVVVDLARGSRLKASLQKIDAGGVRLTRGPDVALVLDPRDVQDLVVDDGGLVFLSSMAPLSAEPSRPFGDDLGLTYAPRFDRNVLGGPLASGGRRYTRGIGVHAPSRIAWKVEPGFARLVGAVAIDDSVLRLSVRGSVRFRVLVDGKERFASAVVRGGEPPVRFDVPLDGGVEIALETEVADEAHIADRANWLDLTLLRAEKQ